MVASGVLCANRYRRSLQSIRSTDKTVLDRVEAPVFEAPELPQAYIINYRSVWKPLGPLWNFPRCNYKP